jgi:hypothetical protein
MQPSSPLVFFTPAEPGFWVLILLFDRHLAISVRPLAWVPVSLLLPYLAFISGALSPRLTGMQQIDWMVTVQTGLPMTVGLLLLAGLVRLFLANTQTARPAPGAQPAGLTFGALLTGFAGAGLSEFFLCFLRGALWEILLRWPQEVSTPGYWALWAAAPLALPWLLLRTKEPQERFVLAGILIATTALFFLTRNFWLCWLAHALLAGLLANRTAATAPPEPAAPNR